MRYTGLAPLLGAAVLFACGGGGDQPPQSAPPPATTAAPAPLTAVPAMPITGDTVVVRMTFTPPAAYVFEPAAITVKAGDGINFLTISGQPHNVRFDPNGKAAADVRSQVNANMPEKAGDLTSIPLLEVNKPYIVSFAGVKPGTYEVDCPLHFANGMKMTVTVQ